tara:strand:+ start:1977 stop:2720 length:744 start_codon:yes stop_codon:yes gene_type:complete
MQDHFDITPAPTPLPEPEPEVSLEGTTAPAVKMEVNEETEEENPQFVYEEEKEGRYEEDELDDIEIPDMPVKRTKLANDDVFSTPVIAPVAPVKKVRKKRKPMTPEQLEKLAQARKKAFATKALKKKERDEMKVLEQKVAKKKKAKQHQEIIDELSDDELPETFKKEVPYTPPQQRAHSSSSKRSEITHDDLMRAVASGVETYDRKRKAEKKVKKEKQAQEARQTDNVRKIAGAMAMGTSPWDQFLK